MGLVEKTVFTVRLIWYKYVGRFHNGVSVARIMDYHCVCGGVI